MILKFVYCLCSHIFILFYSLVKIWHIAISIARCDFGDIVVEGGFTVTNFASDISTISNLRAQPQI
jgi:hypothetical protein